MLISLFTHKRAHGAFPRRERAGALAVLSDTVYDRNSRRRSPLSSKRRLITLPINVR